MWDKESKSVVKILIENASFKLLLARVLVVLVPSYLIAYLTSKMVYVVPTVAATVMIAAGMQEALSSNRRIDSSDTHEELEEDLESNGD